MQEGVKVKWNSYTIMGKKSVGIINYGMGNLYSLANAIKKVGFHPHIIDTPSKLLNSDYAILPGVGAFPDAMKKLKSLKMDLAIQEFTNLKRPLLGICLGMQLLCTQSSEHCITSGLGLLNAQVNKFSTTPGYKIPQIQWNSVSAYPSSKLMRGVNPDSYFYFLHSYYVQPEPNNTFDAMCYTSYCGINYCSIIEKDNIFATQFHPEKSGSVGHALLKNFLTLGV